MRHGEQVSCKPRPNEDHENNQIRSVAKPTPRPRTSNYGRRTRELSSTRSFLRSGLVCLGGPPTRQCVDTSCKSGPLSPRRSSRQCICNCSASGHRCPLCQVGELAQGDHAGLFGFRGGSSTPISPLPPEV